MARTLKTREVLMEPKYKIFKPDAITKNSINLTVDEFETIRCIDYFKMTQEECAKSMNVARTTIQAIYEQARFKISCALVNGYILNISGGDYVISSKPNPKIKNMEDLKMKIAVTYENGLVFQHFGKTEEFKIVTVENGKIINSKIISTNGQGHALLASFLANEHVDALICGGIGGGAINALNEFNIKIIGGVSGNVDEAIEKFIANELVFKADPTCNCHDDEHHCENHEHKNHECHCKHN